MNATTDDIDRLGELPLLESVSVYGFASKANGSVSRLSRFSHITRLRCRGWIETDFLQEIGDIHSLRELELFWCNASLEGLARLTNLEMLHLHAASLTERDSDTLGSLPRLKKLTIPAPNDLRTMLPILRSTSLERIETWTKGFQGEDEFLRAAGERGIPVFWPSWPDPANAKYLKPKASAPASDETSE